jgi:hypothetical protein
MELVVGDVDTGGSHVGRDSGAWELCPSQFCYGLNLLLNIDNKYEKNQLITPTSLL